MGILIESIVVTVRNLKGRILYAGGVCVTELGRFLSATTILRGLAYRNIKIIIYLIN